VPELPEVETVRRQLEPLLKGARVRWAWSRLARRTFPTPEEFVDRLVGSRVLGASRRGKQLYFPLDAGDSLFVHLGMSGRLFVEEEPADFEPEAFDPADVHKHVHAIVSLEADPGSSGSNRGPRRLAFSDPRTFGSIGIDREVSLIKTMGPEPLDADFDERALVEKLKKRIVKIKAALLDQKLVAGLGNIYADEVCFEAGVHPAAPACDLTEAQLSRVVSLLKPVLERAIAARGATLKDGGYQDTFGERGEFIPQVYGRTGEPCTTCGRSIERGVLGNSRTSRSYHFCPHCQPLPD